MTVPPSGGGTTKTYHFIAATIHQVFRRCAPMGFLHGAKLAAVGDMGCITLKNEKILVYQQLLQGA